MISVLIPAFNEAERIVETIHAVRELPYSLEIVVVDDGSTDGTAKKAKEAGADQVKSQPNLGKGAALKTAFRMSRGTTFVLLDADLGETAAEAAKLLKPILEDRADMTVALFPKDPAAKPGGAGRVVRRAREGIFRLTRRTMKAPLSGQRAMKRELIEACGGFESGWGVEVALTVCALKQGFRVEEIPTQMKHRVTGRSLKAVLHRFQQYRQIGRVLKRLEGEARREALAAAHHA